MNNEKQSHQDESTGMFINDKSELKKIMHFFIYTTMQKLSMLINFLSNQINKSTLEFSNKFFNALKPIKPLSSK